MVGPYKILNKEGNLYKVKLPDLIKVYPIFSLISYRRLQITYYLDKRISLPYQFKLIAIINRKLTKY